MQTISMNRIVLTIAILAFLQRVDAALDATQKQALVVISRFTLEPRTP
jgi:hypothetical protein